jgi:hypothetical protein
MRWRGSFVFVLAGLVIAMGSCAQEEYPAALWIAQHPSSSSSASIGDAIGPLPSAGPATCSQALAESLPARLGAMGAGGDAGADAEADAGPAGTTYFVEDLYTDFTAICGRCHGQVQALGGFQIATQAQFQTSMTTDVLSHIQSNGGPTDPDPMPPFDSSAGMPYSQRPDTDPVKQFAELVQQWLMDGSPASFVYTLPSTASSQMTTVSTIPIPNAAIGNAMTNIGNCIPSPGLVGTEQTQSAALDSMFASATAMPAGPGVSAQQMIGLPLHLSETDLFTFDSATLAQYGVIAYAPGYPLWSDNAGKLRYIRVPRGTSVRFDEATQSFEIPPNTRFYKTFMKQIVDTDGSLRYRKIETRLIVSRPDQVNADGTTTPMGLFGSYQWNDDESDAVLVTLPLNSGDPFADTLFEYVTNAPLAADILSGNPADPEEALIEGNAARHYAIPSSQRCVECHEGSESHSFVLGFLPLQINRRPQGTSGVLEEAGPDELIQMQRFIDYGLISGMTSPSDVLPLEKSEGSRAPRNNYELLAQGYMLGNCAHCHNPGGYPSLQNPVLVDVLNFVPGPNSGIFQFSLETTSPRIFRGADGQTPIPYITPSLIDLPRLNNGTGGPLDDVFVSVTANPSGGVYEQMAWFAPWRSLIYRNTDNPFAYTDDFALYPHMPMNTPGYDPRAKQIFSDWMVSIPAIRKRPDVPEYAVYSGVASGGIAFGSAVDWSPQPYVEVLPGDPRYSAAQVAAQQRLSILHTGINPDVATGPATAILSRYADRGDTADILDPAVLADPICTPVPVPEPPQILGSSGGELNEPVPGHCHWFPSDSSQPPGPWSPRRPDWASVLVALQPDISPPACGGASAGQQGAETDESTAVTLLQSVTLDSVTNYLTTPVPFGLWEQQSGCDFSSEPTVGSFTSANQPLWMSLDPGLSPDAPVYTQSPGQAVFKMICINCHGPIANADGRLAQNLAIMTGDLAQVADFRDGLFGPVGGAESNLHQVFGTSTLEAAVPSAPASWTGITDEDRASRYMAWMALGGTKVQIPIGILDIVAVTQVLDQHRQLQSSGLSANMLSSAKTLCSTLLGRQEYGDTKGFEPTNPVAYSASLIHSNGDAELWLQLCSLNNPPPIHVISANNGGVQQVFSDGLFVEDQGGTQLLEASSYPAGAPVGDHRGNTVPYVANNPNTGPDSQTPENLWPWCNAPGTNNGGPQCPDGAMSPANTFTSDDEEAWTVRGAINAGLGVFLYVKSLETMSSPPPDYDQCQLLR